MTKIFNVIFMFIIMAMLLGIPVSRAWSKTGAGLAIAALVGDRSSSEGSDLKLKAVDIRIMIRSKSTKITYVVKNNGEAKKVTIGMPVIKEDFSTDEGIENHDEKEDLVTVDGKQIKDIRKVYSKSPTDKEYQKDSKDLDYYLVDVPFDKGQQRKIVFESSLIPIRSRDDIGLTEISILEASLHGQRSWSGGKAESIMIEVDFGSPKSYCLAVNMKGAHYDATKRRLTWWCTDCLNKNRFVAWWVLPWHLDTYLYLGVDDDVGYSHLFSSPLEVIDEADKDDDMLAFAYNLHLSLYRVIPPDFDPDHRFYGRFSEDDCAYNFYGGNVTHWWLGDDVDKGISLEEIEHYENLEGIEHELTRRGIPHPPLPPKKR